MFNEHIEELLKCVNRKDEFFTWNEVEKIIDQIYKENLKLSRKQIIQTQIALLDSDIKETSKEKDLNLSCMIIVAAVALIGNLTGVRSLENNIVITIFMIYNLLLFFALAIIIGSMFFQRRKKNKLFLKEILTYMLEEPNNDKKRTKSDVISHNKYSSNRNYNRRNKSSRNKAKR